MEASILCQVSEQYKAFCCLSHRDKIASIGMLLLCLTLVVAAIIWLPRLFDSRPWIAYSAGALLFINWIWREGYPALKRRIAEEYREITAGGLRKVLARLYKDTGSFWVLLRFAIFLLLLYPFAILLRAALPFLFHPIFLVTLSSICSLAFIHWVWRRAYPALQQRLGPTAMRYVCGALVMAKGGLAFVFAHQYINTVTGVAPDNFPKALAALTTLAIVPASIFTTALTAALIGFIFMVAMAIDMVRCEIQNYWQQFRSLLGLALPQARPLLSGRIVVNLLGAFSIFGLCSLLVAGEVQPINHLVRAVAVYTLVATEFSHDHTCPASSQERLVARIKDFTERKPPRVLFVEGPLLRDVRFSIGTCE